MARKPRTPKIEAQETNQFLDALKFVSTVLQDKGTPIETHMKLQGKTVIGFNGIIGAGSLIQEDIFAAPNAKLIVEALSKCGKNLSITQLDNGRLSIKSDKFKAIVPCIDPNSISSIMPDAPVVQINDSFKKAIEAVGVLTDENAQRVVAASILIRSGSCLATNGTIIFEAWHGLSMPDINVPKSFALQLGKISKTINSFGFSENSFTIWFENNSWFKTQLFKEKWPDISNILNIPTNPFIIPKDFWIGLEAITPFSKDGFVYFEDGLLKTDDNGQGASYEVSGIPKGPIYNIKNLMTIKNWAKEIDFVARNNNGICLAAYGENIRGFIAGRE